MLLTAQGADTAVPGQPTQEGETATETATPAAEGIGSAGGLC